jgi:hypothetical protein
MVDGVDNKAPSLSPKDIGDSYRSYERKKKSN